MIRIMDFDILIKNGILVDGDAHNKSHVDIGIRNEKIGVVQPNLESKADVVLDAENLIVVPGFIDMHSHSDFIIPVVGSADSFIRQGITTAVAGMCGSSLAPINPQNRDEFIREMISSSPLLSDVEISWNTFDQYLNEMERIQTSINLAFVVGYESLRIGGGAGFEKRFPTKREIEVMKQLLGDAMSSGAFGMSTGLIYAPQVFAETSEIIELAKILARYDGLYFSHIRGEGASVFDAILEVERIVHESGCRGGHIAHHKIADKNLWGQSSKSLGLIHSINKRGISITVDSYPYDRGCSSLITALPPWAREGGVEESIKRVRDENTRRRIISEVEENINEDTSAIWENWINTAGFENIFVSTVESEKWDDITGLSITEISQTKGLDEWDVFFNILQDDNGATMVTLRFMSEVDVRRIMTSEYHMFGTDGMATTPDYKSGIDHPRSYGTYPRILRKYVREEGLLSLRNAIAKMTTIPANRLGLPDRGRINPGCWADLVIFDHKTISDTATYENPTRFPVGIRYVIVNGKIVVENNSQCRIFPGRVLRFKSPLF
ncbi:MAG: D-aminoacylase [Candidatus Thorarchaeota archaeon]|nr:MAG: D-aminoacylase [Candidatus Thorarchaeota archaeon]